MNNFAVSIYPERCSQETLKNYLALLKKNKVTNIFVSMINYVKDDENKRKEFDEMLKMMGSDGFHITADIDHRLLKELKISVFNPDLTFFKERFITRIRLDYQMDGMLEAVLTKNSDNIEIAVNASTATTNYLKNILSHGANKKNLVASHNFYPEEFTGLDFEQFKMITREIKSLGVKTSAFITHTKSQNGEGPLYRKCGDLPETMPTIERLRTLPLEVQTNFYFTSGFMDEIVLATQFVTQEQLAQIKAGMTNQKILLIQKEQNIQEAEQKIIEFDKILIREDIGQNLMRCSFTSYIFRDQSITPRKYDSDIFPIGSIVIPNDDYVVYKGELEIIKEEIPNNGLRNYVGRIIPEQLFMINEIKPYDVLKFKFFK